MSKKTQRFLIRLLIAAAVFVAAVILHPRLAAQAREAAVAAALDEAADGLDQKLPPTRPDLKAPYPASLFLDGKDAREFGDLFRKRLARSKVLDLRPTGKVLHAIVDWRPNGDVLVGLSYDEFSSAPATVEKSHAPVPTSKVLIPLAVLLVLFVSGVPVVWVIAGLAVVAGVIAVAAGWNPLTFLT